MSGHVNLPGLVQTKKGTDCMVDTSDIRTPRCTYLATSALFSLEKKAITFSYIKFSTFPVGKSL